MIEIIVAVVLFVFLLNKINSVSDRVRLLEKSEKSAQTTQSSYVSSVPIKPTTEFSATIPEMPGQASSQVPPPAPALAINNEEWGGKALGIAGVLAVTLGVSFFLRYAFVNNWIGPAGRVMIGLFIGIVLISIGQYFREKYRNYSNILIGCGIGILYLTTFAAFAFYNLISSPVAYGLLIGITALSVVLSVVDNAMVLATIGIVGGFLTPVFMTLSNASIEQVLTYILILDLGVMVTALTYHWRRLAVVAFAGTWILLIPVFSNLYVVGDKAVMCVFLTLYFIVFLTSSVAHHIVRKESSENADLGLVTVNALAYAGVMYSLLHISAKGYIGFFMLGLAIIYFLISYVSFESNKGDKILNLFLPAISALFLTLAIPAQFEGPWIAMAWFVEAIILYAVDYFLKGKNLYAYGGIVFIVAAIYTFSRYAGEIASPSRFVPVLNERFFIFVVAIIACYALAFILWRAIKSIGDIEMGDRKGLIAMYFVVAQLATLFIVTTEINAFYVNNNNFGNTVVDIFWILYASAIIAIGFGVNSKMFRVAGLCLMLASAIKIFVDIWDLGPVYRIVTSLAFGVIALIASFVYAKYKDKFKEKISTMLMIMLVLGAVSSVTTLVFSPKTASAESEGRTIVESLKFRSEINSGSLITGRPARFLLTPEIEDLTNMDDIRIFTGISNQVPYRIFYSNEVSRDQSVSLPVQNLSTRSGRIEFIIDTKGDAFVHRGMNLSSGSQINFRYLADVYASDDNISIDSSKWRKISGQNGYANQYIFNFSDSQSGQTISNTKVSYQPSNSRYVKIVLTPLDIMESNGSMSGAVTFKNDLSAYHPANVDFIGTFSGNNLTSGFSDFTLEKPVKISENLQNKSTEINAEVSPNLGVFTNSITLKTNSDNFYRHVSVQVLNPHFIDQYGVLSSVEGSNWQTIASGVIYSLNSGVDKIQNLTINYPSAKTQQIRLVISNDDNQPLIFSDSVTLNSPAISVAFIPSAVGPHYLYFNGNLQAPIYDIDKVLSNNANIEESAISTVSLNEVKLNPVYKAPAGPVVPFSERYPWFLNTALVILIVFIGWMIFVYARKVVR